MPPVSWRASWIAWFLSNDSVPANTASENASSIVNTLDPSCDDGTFWNQAVSVAVVLLVTAWSAKDATSLPAASWSLLAVPDVGGV